MNIEYKSSLMKATYFLICQLICLFVLHNKIEAAACSDRYTCVSVSP